MNQQQLLFDSGASEAAKNQGMAQAAENKRSLLEYARKIAVELAKVRGIITADDVQMELHRRGISIRALGSAAGSLFADKKVWQWTGDFVKSKRTHSHSNLLRAWRLRK